MSVCNAASDCRIEGPDSVSLSTWVNAGTITQETVGFIDYRIHYACLIKKLTHIPLFMVNNPKRPEMGNRDGSRDGTDGKTIPAACRLTVNHSVSERK